ncbi:uncharacterized protein LACBIDRAFT_253472 [Laccaria bicolor S238N-H82]|uniref:Predicted protein n=1 Tax=Laccaria bicolor (strain S238N-H82 / ATCC MYA-4686) TaxID=486041 RepID=B0DQA4_LACBS|nr:uncharacterized protein LACBIDRAFT_253472 [Laccaria bicolor S238N-H82]EDR03259.1 predicted protein [Laccaria bicolor S238N-H82]|eukprot:XP_001886055.1 predicted protein [Laccaria bicolor S238N-H82]
MAEQQKALLLPVKLGEFTLGTTQVYKPGPGELLVKNKAASLNPVDWKVRKYHAFIKEYPAILGLDIAGDVEYIGEGVTGFLKGDRVLSQGQFERQWGGFQQYVKTTAVTTTKIPENISYEQAATIPLALTTAYAGLYSNKPNGGGLEAPVEPTAVGKYAGSPIVVLGGSSSVGQYGNFSPVIQLAKLSGFSPIITTSSVKHTEYLKSLGATHVVDRNSPLLAQIKDITTQPILFVYDAISERDTQQAGLDILAAGGTMVTVLPAVGSQVEGKEIIHVAGLLKAPAHLTLLETLYGTKLSGWLEEGTIKPNRVEYLPGGLGGIVAGLKRMEDNEVSGVKLVVNPQDTE